jgi:hypothetical protein
LSSPTDPATQPSAAVKAAASAIASTAAAGMISRRHHDRGLDPRPTSGVRLMGRDQSFRDHTLQAQENPTVWDGGR